MYIESKLLYFLAIYCTLFFLRLYLPPSYFADYIAYENIVNNSSSIFDNSLYEWLTYATFSLFGNLRLLGLDPVYWLYIYNFLLVGSLFFLLIKISSNTLSGVFIIMALYAALFSYVLLRAAPAYLVIALSVVYGSIGKKKTSSLLAFISIFYHISAVLPAIVVVLLNINSPSIYKLSGIFFKLSIVLAILQIINIWLGVNIMPSALIDVISEYESIEKYGVYVENSNKITVYHVVYFIISCSIIILLRIKDVLVSKYLALYFYILFGLCAVMIISPVAAFRMSIFYMLPLLLIFPWNHFLNGIARYFIYIFSPFLFYFSFSGLVAK